LPVIRRRGLTELIEFLLVNPKLVQDSVEERRADLSSTMNWDRRGTAILMPPAFVAPGLARLHKTSLLAARRNSSARALGMHDLGCIGG
jgi:hypothetical protein